jgi:hypothetical protein
VIEYSLISGPFPTRLTPATIVALILTFRIQKKNAKWVFQLASPYVRSKGAEACSFITFAV